MPQFSAGAVKTARITITNLKAIATECSIMLFMGVDMVLKAEASLSLNAGQSKEVLLTVTMPSVVGSYPVYIGAFSGGVLIPPYYHATEDVAIIALPPANLTFGVLTGGTFYLWGFAQPILRCVITNNSGVAIIGRDVLAFARYISPQSGLPVVQAGSITSTITSYGMPAYGPAPGLISLLPGQSISIDWAPAFSITRDVINTLWLQDAITGDKSNEIFLP